MRVSSGKPQQNQGCFMGAHVMRIAPILLGMHMLTAMGFAAEPDSARTRALTELLKPFDDLSSPGVAVLVIKDGHTVFHRGYGMAILREKSPITPRSNLRLASVTKQFTSTAIMLLVREGKLRYADKLTDIFPGFPAYGKPITIRNLLNHTSGLLDYEDLMDAHYTSTSQISDDQVLALLEQQDHTKFPPGYKWDYSNSAYVLLGKVVEKISGISFPDFLRRRIFLPLGMSNTVAFVKNMNQVQHRAFGYSRDGQSWKDTDQSSTSATLGDGGVYSSLDDLGKWYLAMDHHKLLSAAEMHAAFTPVKLADGSTKDYGFAWRLDPYRGRPRMHHDGTTSGFHNHVERYPAESLTIVLLANRTDIDAQKLADQIADIYLAP